MTTYYSKSEIQTTIKLLVADYVKNFINRDKISDDFVDLIKYNFLAKYVSFNVKKHSIEIGVEDMNTTSSSYPVINVITYPVSETNNKWLDRSFKNQKIDLIFYGGLINRKKYNHRNAEVIVM